MEEQKTLHVPVLKRQVLEYLCDGFTGSYLDCTLGGAGHAEAILKANSQNTLFAIDRDQRAIERAARRLSQYADRSALQKSSFADLKDVCGDRKFDRVLADLGLSTDQLYEERGFSFRDENSLDMRMDEGSALTADEIVNSWDHSSLRRALQVGGVGKDADKISKNIIQSRPIRSAAHLREVVTNSIRQRDRKKHVDPSTVVFQAIRITVNDEFSQIEELLNVLPEITSENARVAIISFHSLEDKLVARTFRNWQGSEFSAMWPGSKGKDRLGKLLTGKAILPDEEEVSENPASRSARMRVFEFERSVH